MVVDIDELEQSNCLEEIRIFRRSISIQDHFGRSEEHNDDLQGVGRVSRRMAEKPETIWGRTKGIT